MIGIDSPGLSAAPAIANYVLDFIRPNLTLNEKEEYQGREAYVNLKGLIAVTEKYGFQENIKSILMNASVSAHNGSEFPRYAASKGGVLAYTKYVAREVAKYGATCNSLSFGGVTTALNNPIINDEKLYKAVLDETLLKKWATPEECAEWIYFMTVINKSMTAQDVLIDNGEVMNQKFIWPN